MLQVGNFLLGDSHQSGHLGPHSFHQLNILWVFLKVLSWVFCIQPADKPRIKAWRDLLKCRVSKTRLCASATFFYQGPPPSGFKVNWEMWFTLYIGRGGKPDLVNIYSLSCTRFFCVVSEQLPSVLQARPRQPQLREIILVINDCLTNHPQM